VKSRQLDASREWRGCQASRQWIEGLVESWRRVKDEEQRPTSAMKWTK
jgi:hypothetical protein